MKKLIVPAIVIAAVGAYFYYQNQEPAAPEEAIVEELDAAVEEAAMVAGEEEAVGTKVVASNDEMEAEGDVFADPEQVTDGAVEAVEAAAEGVGDPVEDAMDEMPGDEIDHADE